ncbi:MAG: TonB family protein [Proteobacteria bacterium]|nr:TonB family protein [Pseudomonadota bacterium]
MGRTEAVHAALASVVGHGVFALFLALLPAVHLESQDPERAFVEIELLQLAPHASESPLAGPSCGRDCTREATPRPMPARQGKQAASAADPRRSYHGSARTLEREEQRPRGRRRRARATARSVGRWTAAAPADKRETATPEVGMEGAAKTSATPPAASSPVTAQHKTATGLESRAGRSGNTASRPSASRLAPARRGMLGMAQIQGTGRTAYQHWYRVLHNRIARRLVFPRRRQLEMDQGTSRYRIWVRRDGSLARAPALIRSSGFDDLDQAALAAIEQSAPFPAVPRDFAPRAREIAIRVPIEFSNPMFR